MLQYWTLAISRGNISENKKTGNCKKEKGPKAAKLRNENKGMAKLRDRLN